MKITFIISAMNGGGAERVIATLANKYVEQGDQVTILMVAGNESAYPLDKRIQVLSIGRPSYGNPLIQAERLYAMRKYFKAHRDKCFVSFGTQINIFSILAGVGLQLNLTVSERNDPNQCSYKRFRNLIYSLGDKFVFQTEDAKRCFPKRIWKQSYVIPNPIRNDLPKVYAEIRKKKIVAVGRLEPQKNQKMLLQAFAGFQKKYPEYELHLFGRGSLEDTLRALTDNLGITKNVIFEGFADNVLEQMKDSSMYVLSSDYEGMSNSLMEAMAIGLPCISTDCPIGGSAMCIQNDVNGILTPVGDTILFQAAMERIAGDPKWAEKLGQEAVQIREKFKEEKITEMWRRCMLGEK